MKITIPSAQGSLGMSPANWSQSRGQPLHNTANQGLFITYLYFSWWSGGLVESQLSDLLNYSEMIQKQNSKEGELCI